MIVDLSFMIQVGIQVPWFMVHLLKSIAKL